MTTWDEPNDIHIEHDGKRYKLRRVTDCWRLWYWRGPRTMSNGCWVNAPGPKRLAEVLKVAKLDVRP